MRHRFSDTTANELRARLALLRTGLGRASIDGDAHVSDLALLPPPAAARLAATPDYYHGRPITADELVAELDLAAVDLALIWQNPAATARGDDPVANHAALLAANRAIYHAAERHPTRLIPAGWTDPGGLGLERALELVDTCVRDFGFTVIKLNPAQNRFPIDDPRVFAIVDRILAHGAIPAFHVGGDTPFTPAAGLARIAAHAAPHRVIAVHMGGGGSGYVEGETLYQEIRELGLRAPNLFFVQSAKRDTHLESDLIRYLLAGPPHDTQIALGSDAPYGRVSWNFGGARAVWATLADPRHPDPRVRAHLDRFNARARQNHLGDNLLRLLIAAHAAWLE